MAAATMVAWAIAAGRPADYQQSGVCLGDGGAHHPTGSSARRPCEKRCRENLWRWRGIRKLDEVAGALVEGTAARLEIEAALPENEAELRAAAEFSPQHSWTTGRDGRLLSLSSRASMSMGVSAGHASSNGCRPVHSGDSVAVEHAWARSVATAASFDHEFRVAGWCGAGFHDEELGHGIGLRPDTPWPRGRMLPVEDDALLRATLAEQLAQLGVGWPGLLAVMVTGYGNGGLGLKPERLIVGPFSLPKKAGSAAQFT